MVSLFQRFETNMLLASTMRKAKTESPPIRSNQAESSTSDPRQRQSTTAAATTAAATTTATTSSRRYGHTLFPHPSFQEATRGGTHREEATSRGGRQTTKHHNEAQCLEQCTFNPRLRVGFCPPLLWHPPTRFAQLIGVCLTSQLGRESTKPFYTVPCRAQKKRRLLSTATIGNRTSL